MRTADRLADNLGSLDIELEPEELRRLDEVSRVSLGFPGEFGGGRLAYGNTLASIQDHRRTVDAIV